MTLKSKKTSYLITILISLFLLCSVILLMQYVQSLLRSDMWISLSEIVNQNKNIVTSKLALELNNLNVVATQISDRISQTGDISNENVRRQFLDYTQRETDTVLSWSDTKGNAMFSGGQEVNIAGRKYFQVALEGNSNVSEQLISRLTGEDIFVISVPLYYNNEIIGTIQKQYPPTEMYALCSIPLFSQQGSMYIINSDGYILISSDHTNYNESSNYYRMLYLSNPDAATLMEQNIRAGASGFMELTMDGKELFSAYTPLEEIHDWYLITSVITNAVMPNANIVVRLFYVILVLMVLSFAIILFYNLWLKRNQQLHLEKMAFVDNVTGGDTYTKFMADFPWLLENSGNASYYILVFDIDGFHYINRFHGFETGDAVLKEVNLLCAAQLQQDERIAHISADQFVAALRNQAPSWINDILCAGINYKGIGIHFSCGLYPVKDKSEGLNLMVDKATLASSEVKGKRFKQVGVYSAEFDEALAKSEQLKQDIDRALAAGEFTPFFQPKVDIRTRQLVGAEALARWIQKDGTLISPGAFIPISEQTGVIRLIDWTIFEKTLQFIKNNLDNDVTCTPISVNFSRNHLFDVGFIGKMKTLLERYQVPGNLIEIEITETAIFDNSHTINMFIAQLHELGLTVSMDDFGSGYSSLHMLKDVDIDVLKIDQAFLNSASNREKQQIIFETITQMSTKLKLKTVVEGVETAENVDAMQKTECTVAQGYFFARPMNSDAFEICYQEGKV